MARLIDWPRDLAWQSREPLTGPRAEKSASGESVTGFQQTVASPFGLWRWRFTFTPLKGQAFRRYGGTMLAQQGGANALRVPFGDPDGLTWAQLGVSTTRAEIVAGVPFVGGRPWSNGRNWRAGRPLVPVAVAAARGSSIVTLAGAWWGGALGIGDRLGFAPLHFGLYVVTEVLAPGRYRIWPPLRKQIGPADFGTLAPVLAMKLESEGAASAGRNVETASALTVTLLEIEDADVRRFYRG